MTNKSPVRPRGPRFRLKDEEKEKFIELLAAGVGKLDAAEMLNRNLCTFSDHARKDPEFKARVDTAWYDGADVLIREVERRGAEGVLEPIVQKGEHVLGRDGLPMYVRKYSDVLLMCALGGRRQEYKQNPKVELTQNNLALNFEDRSAAISDMWRVLDAAGVNAKELSETKPAIINGSVAPKQLMAAPEGTVAEPTDL